MSSARRRAQPRQRPSRSTRSLALKRADQAVVVKTSDWITRAPCSTRSTTCSCGSAATSRRWSSTRRRARPSEGAPIEPARPPHPPPPDHPPGRAATPDARQRHLRLRAPRTPQPHRRQQLALAVAEQLVNRNPVELACDGVAFVSARKRARVGSLGALLPLLHSGRLTLDLRDARNHHESRS
jgi:hypothetical protein